MPTGEGGSVTPARPGGRGSSAERLAEAVSRIGDVKAYMDSLPVAERDAVVERLLGPEWDWETLREQI